MYAIGFPLGRVRSDDLRFVFCRIRQALANPVRFLSPAARHLPGPPESTWLRQFCRLKLTLLVPILTLPSSDLESDTMQFLLLICLMAVCLRRAECTPAPWSDCARRASQLTDGLGLPANDEQDPPWSCGSASAASRPCFPPFWSSPQWSLPTGPSSSSKPIPRLDTPSRSATLPRGPISSS